LFIKINTKMLLPPPPPLQNIICEILYEKL
jgi:hypothetical protein